MPDQITARRLGELLSQLCAALGKPFGAKGEKMLPGYHRGLEDWPEEAIEWAIWRACKTWDSKSFPKPAELAKLCAQSPHKRLEPDNSAEPAVEPSERCPDCREWWGWHRVASLFTGTAALVYVNGIRHRSDCPRHRAQERELRVYQRSWVDGQPPAGHLEAGGQAWLVAGVLQLIYPVPPLPPEPKRRPASERIQRRRSHDPVPIDEIQAEQLEDLVPVPPDAGDAWEQPTPTQTSALQ